MSIVWRDSMKIGDPELDAEHKKFIALLNLIERGLQQKDVSPAVDIFEELLIYVETHLPAEEAYMERIGYPGLEDHKVLHEEFAYNFYVLLGRFRASIDDAERRRHVVKLAEMVREWLIDHILKEIIELKPYAPIPVSQPPKPVTTPWLVPFASALGLKNPPMPTVAPAPAVTDLPPAAPIPIQTAAVAAPSSGEWRSIGTLPPHLELYLKPLDYTVPRPPAPITEFPGFQQLCEAAIWRSVNKVLTFFQRHNEDIVRDLPPLFLATPEFARNFKAVLEESIFPAMWETRRMKMLLTNFDRSMADDETFFSKLGKRNTDHVLSVWAQTWNGLRLIETQGVQGFTIMKIKEDTKKIRSGLQPPSAAAYDMPKIGNREIELFKALLDPANDWWQSLSKLWKPCHDYYVQEKTPIGDPDIREGTLRDHLIDVINILPDPWGDFMLLTAHRVFPRLDCTFLESFVTNFGRTEVAREAVIPYTMRYLRQVRARPDILAREQQEEEEWQGILAELRKYRSWRSA
ncbi:MAG TPA: hemerythrin domain-containing protein [Magnetospirillaceae bacterium]|nr:hemerythrin domain-containing protein [Magnetospirillaceae bacterium]